eukprot:scaffold18264_cov67-Phaeocystis_antarctica.AAC.4
MQKLLIMLLLSAVTGVEADCADHPVDCDDQQILHDLGLSYDSYDQDHLGALAFTLTLTLNLTPTTTSSPHPNPKPNRISSPNPDPTLTSRRAIGQGCGDTRRRLPDRRHPRRRAGRAGRRPGGRQEPLWGQRQGADRAGARLDSRTLLEIGTDNRERWNPDLASDRTGSHCGHDGPGGGEPQGVRGRWRLGTQERAWPFVHPSRHRRYIQRTGCYSVPLG